MNQMFSVQTTPEELKNAATTGHFVFVFEKTRTGKSHDCKIFIFVIKLLSFHMKTKKRRFQIPPV